MGISYEEFSRAKHAFKDKQPFVVVMVAGDRHRVKAFKHDRKYFVEYVVTTSGVETVRNFIAELVPCNSVAEIQAELLKK